MTRHNLPRSACALAFVFASLIFCTAGQGQTWDGGGADSNFNTVNNWNPNVAPVNNGTAILIFDGVTRLTPSGNVAYDVGSITFAPTAGNFQLGGGSHLTIRSG